jgi:hypothetical protein
VCKSLVLDLASEATRPSSEDRLSLILTKRSGRWLIVHGHNTVIDQGAQRFDPVKTGWPDAAPKSA